MICWHLPGRQIRPEVLACRHCGVAIEECPCVPVLAHKVYENFPTCLGSGFVAILRSRYTKYREAIAV